MTIKDNLIIQIFYKSVIPPEVRPIKKAYKNAVCLTDICDNEIENISKIMKINITKLPAIFITLDKEKIEYVYESFDIKEFKTFVDNYYKKTLKQRVSEVCINLKNILQVEEIEVKQSIIEETISLITVLSSVN